MTSTTNLPSASEIRFPPFDLARLLQNSMHPAKGEKLCILIDLEHPTDLVNNAFLEGAKHPIQKRAFEQFYLGLLNGVMQQFQLSACDIFAYKTTGGSNLELPLRVTKPDGSTLSLENDIYPKYQIILCISTYSATAPLTAEAKKYGFRGATMHGLNDIILMSGLAVDYNNVSKQTELLRRGLTGADFVEIDFQIDHHDYHLHVDLGKQEAQKSHGICEKGEIANLPAGEVYFVPASAKGSFPIKFEEDGTLGLFEVSQGKVSKARLIKGNQKTVDKYQKKFSFDPASAIIGELGFGTQVLPYSGADIQDEKIFGTFHLATGRNDHLNGNVTKERFLDLRNATHDDILFSSTKTPEIHVKQVRMKRNDKMEILIENYHPAAYLLDLLKG